MAEKELSIIIVSYNTRKITEDCLESIWRSLQGIKLDYEIIVVDNNSKDGSREMLSQMVKIPTNNLKVINSEKNLGFGKANNQAVIQAQGKYLLFLNTDVVVLGQSISKLLNFYQQSEKKINFLGGKLLNNDLTPQASAAWFYSLPVTFAALFLRGDYYNLTRFSPNILKKVDWVSGACILTTKKIYQQVNGFDENLFMYMEEVDLLYRAHKKGFSTYFYPQAQFIHLGAASSDRSHSVVQVFEGLLFFYRKNYSKLSLTLLKFLLKLKALSAILIGRIIKNNYLITTYEKADRIISMVR